MKDIIKVFPVNCGDAIRIIQKSAKGNPQGNILIDSGYIRTFNVLYDGIRDIIQDGGKIDLWILTHIDADHINGAVEFLRDRKIKDKNKVIKEIWFNFFNPFTVDIATSDISLDKGTTLVDLLKSNGVKSFDNKIINTRKKEDVNGRSITILSPDKKTYKELQEHWKEEEKKYKKIVDTIDCADAETLDTKTIEELSQYLDAKEPTTAELPNRSSIAFLYQSGNRKALFLGDAMPSTIIASLKSMGFTKKKPIKVKYVKLSHHGSRANFSKELLDYIECNDFIISADGVNSNGIPDKEVLAKIITHQKRDRRKELRFHFNYDDPRFRQMFEVDATNIDQYNFATCYPKKGKTLKLKL